MNFYTYFHTRNDTGAVFYVGKGKGKRAHDARRNSHWKRIACKAGHTVHFAMTGLSEKEAFEHEKLLISCFKLLGVNLANMTDGGDGVSGHKHTTEFKKKVSANNAARIWSCESRKKVSRSKYGQRHSEESKLRMSAALKGRVVLQETKDKIGTAHKGKLVSLEARERMKTASAKRWAKAEERAKLSLAKQGTTATEETKAKMVASHTGKVHTQETKDKMAQSRRKFYLRKAEVV